MRAEQLAKPKPVFLADQFSARQGKLLQNGLQRFALH
jgi:hypothetical protein